MTPLSLKLADLTELPIDSIDLRIRLLVLARLVDTECVEEFDLSG